jgi:hypothetical protein
VGLQQASPQEGVRRSHIRKGGKRSGAYPKGQKAVRCISERAESGPVHIRKGGKRSGAHPKGKRSRAYSKGGKLSGAYPTGQGAVRHIV